MSHAAAARMATRDWGAAIEDPVVIRRILDHLKQKADANEPSPLPESRAPPRSLYAR